MHANLPLSACCAHSKLNPEIIWIGWYSILYHWWSDEASCELQQDCFQGVGVSAATEGPLLREEGQDVNVGGKRRPLKVSETLLEPSHGKVPKNFGVASGWYR